jgi:hypothetical protein
MVMLKEKRTLAYVDCGFGCHSVYEGNQFDSSNCINQLPQIESERKQPVFFFIFVNEMNDL